MKVKSVINRCMELLDVGSTKDDLLDCYNSIEKELSLDYFPLYAIQKCNSDTVYYKELEYEAARIVQCSCPFKIYPEYIKAKENIVEVVYTYIPKEKDLFGDCSYNDSFFDCLVYGIISEYLLSQGFFEESIRWTDKYHNEIKSLMLEDTI